MKNREEKDQMRQQRNGKSRVKYTLAAGWAVSGSVSQIRVRHGADKLIQRKGRV